MCRVNPSREPLALRTPAMDQYKRRSQEVDKGISKYSSNCLDISSMAFRHGLAELTRVAPAVRNAGILSHRWEYVYLSIPTGWLVLACSVQASGVAYGPEDRVHHGYNRTASARLPVVRPESGRRLFSLAAPR